jgi:hypothetical protein
LMFSFFVVWKLNFLHRIHRHFWIKSILKLGFKTALGTYDSFNDFMRVNNSDVANSQKIFISSVKKCNMLSKFWMAPSVHNFDKFSLKIKLVFHLARRWLSSLCLWYLTKEIYRFTFPWNELQLVVLFSIT